MSLTLDRQNSYRARYAARMPGWQPATVVYETLIRTQFSGAGPYRLLDMGCGRGGVLEQLIDLTAVQSFGVDPDHVSVREHRLSDLPRAVALAEAIPLPTACVDVVISAWVLEHLPDPARTFDEVARVLKPGGVFIFMAPNRNSPIALLNRLLHPLQDRLVPLLYGRAEADTFPVAYRANTRAQLQALAHSAGMALDALHLIDDPTYLAFNDPLFWLAVQASRLLPSAAAVHLVGACRKLP